MNNLTHLQKNKTNNIPKKINSKLKPQISHYAAATWFTPGDHFPYKVCVFLGLEPSVQAGPISPTSSSSRFGDRVKVGVRVGIGIKVRVRVGARVRIGVRVRDWIGDTVGIIVGIRVGVAVRMGISDWSNLLLDRQIAHWSNVPLGLRLGLEEVELMRSLSDQCQCHAPIKMGLG